jgi:RNA polymerase sigma-70 factor (ECF subfamily)
MSSTDAGSPDGADGIRKPPGDGHSVVVTERSEGAPLRPEGLSFAEIFEAHVPFLWRSAVALGVPEAEADDVCQEVMLVVHRKLPEFDGRALRSWLYGICLRVASDYRKKARVRRERPTAETPDTALGSTQLEELDARRAEARLLTVLDELDDGKRDAFVLFEIGELTLREIAEATDTPLQTLYSRLQAARAHVRERFSSRDSREGHRAAV